MYIYTGITKIAVTNIPSVFRLDVSFDKVFY